MARIRSIKPEYWEDEKIGSLLRDARLLFIGLWNHADDEGRMRANPRYVKAKVFPYDDDLNICDLLARLAAAHLICLYKDDGQEYLWIKNFKKHQKIDRPQSSNLPAPPSDCANEEEFSDTSSTTHGQFDERSTNTQRAITVGVDRSGVDMEGSGVGVLRAGRGTPTLEACKKMCQTLGGSDAQAEKLFWHYESVGWPSNGTSIRVDAIVKRWLLGDANSQMSSALVGVTRNGKSPPNGKHKLEPWMLKYGQEEGLSEEQLWTMDWAPVIKSGRVKPR